MRKEFEMTEAQLAAIMDACKPTPCMIIGGVMPRSPQENANAAWQRLGVELGFKHMTVEPSNGKGERFFTAEVAG
jgi:predicted TIM-barrel fold metal-dependent hydrolase